MSIFVVRSDGKGSFTLSNSTQYDGEKMPGNLAGWDHLGTDPNEIVRDTYETLSERSTTLYHQYPPAASAVNKLTYYGIGAGLAFKSRPDHKTLGWTEKRAARFGSDLTRLIHYKFLELGFYRKQPVIFRGAEVNGDSLLMFLREKGVDLDIVAAGGNQIDYTAWDDNHTLGVKHDAFMRRKGIRKIDGKNVSFVDSAGNQNIVQYMDRLLPSQMRGYPLFYRIISHAKNDDRHNDATVNRAALEASQFLVSKTNQTDLYEQSKQLANINKGLRGAASRIFQSVTGAFAQSPGGIYKMNTDESLELTDLKTPSNNYKDFKRWALYYTAMGTDVPPSVILSDYSDSSYTSHKGALNDFTKTYMYKRKLFIDVVCYIVLREVVKELIAEGLIKAPGFLNSTTKQRAYLAGTWLGPIPGSINPLQEVKAEIEKVKNSFVTRSDTASLYGEDWENHINEWEEEEKRYFEGSVEAMKIRLEKLQQSLNNGDSDNTNDDNIEENQDKNDTNNKGDNK